MRTTTLKPIILSESAATATSGYSTSSSGSRSSSSNSRLNSGSNTLGAQHSKTHPCQADIHSKTFLKETSYYHTVQSPTELEENGNNNTVAKTPLLSHDDTLPSLSPLLASLSLLPYCTIAPTPPDTVRLFLPLVLSAVDSNLLAVKASHPGISCTQVCQQLNKDKKSYTELLALSVLSSSKLAQTTAATTQHQAYSLSTKQQNSTSMSTSGNGLSFVPVSHKTNRSEWEKPEDGAVELLQDYKCDPTSFELVSFLYHLRVFVCHDIVVVVVVVMVGCSWWQR
eukprot:GHVQ01007408.1.p1 GENE.GHVQ01007408.1~~GHVQ01007408.1.p1  ORF type:complete len:283 (-),score=52.15 GHVQ01007408.1:955-1803(-)